MRAALDKLVSLLGLALAVVLVVAGSLLMWGSNFIGGEVHDQLAQQNIYFPPADSPAVAAPEYERMLQYGGMQMTTGAQAEVYANVFIGNHLKHTADGKTYAELSTMSQADPENAELAGQVQTMFRGETLRGLLLNAYAFGTMGTIAGYAAIGAFVAAGVMLILALLGFRSASRHAEPRGRAREPQLT